MAGAFQLHFSSQNRERLLKYNKTVMFIGISDIYLH